MATQISIAVKKIKFSESTHLSKCNLLITMKMAYLKCSSYTNYKSVTMCGSRVAQQLSKVYKSNKTEIITVSDICDILE